MCDLFGLSCNEKDRATRSLPVFAHEYSESNPHGWGIAYYQGSKAVLKKKPEIARKSSEFFKAVDEAKSNIIIAHLRYKTQGKPCEKNCHPFVQRLLQKDWVFAHNGQVPVDDYRHPRSEGDTDSEQVFNFMLDKVREYVEQKGIKGVYKGIVKAIQAVFEEFGRDCSFNFLLSDGAILYAFHHNNKPMFYLRREKEYGGALLVSTQKLSGEAWKRLPENRLLLLSKGGIIVLSNRI